MVKRAGALDWALKAECDTATQKMVLVVMARRGDRSGECYMAYRTIAEEARCAERTVIRIIPELIRQGWIDPIPGRQRRATKTYRLCVDGPPVRQVVRQVVTACRPKY